MSQAVPLTPEAADGPREEATGRWVAEGCLGAKLGKRGDDAPECRGLAVCTCSRVGAGGSTRVCIIREKLSERDWSSAPFISSGANIKCPCSWLMCICAWYTLMWP